jgi:hypothetical protein
VSRIFSKFQEERLIRVNNKAIQILDPAGLNALIGPCALR